MDMKHKGFVALDFEHLYPAHETACEVGAVRVVDGLITGRFYSTIRPHADYCKGRSNSDIIGLTDVHLATSPTFPEVFAQLRSFCGDFPLVAHHSATELAVLDKCCALYGITDVLGNGEVFDTYEPSRRSLVDCCREYGITLSEHHHPLQDAEATARLFLTMTGTKEVVPIRGERKAHVAPIVKSVHRKFSELVPDDEVVNKDTPFFGGTKTVVTGQFLHFANAGEVEEALHHLGADIKGSVSKITKILVIGSLGAGPSKMQKAQEYGCRIIDEEELMRYIDPIIG